MRRSVLAWRVASQPCLDFGQRRQRGLFARLQQLVTAAEAVPGDGTYVGRNHQIAGGAPTRLGAPVKDLEAAVHHFKHMARRRRFRLRRQVDGDYMSGAKLTGELRRDLPG